jgi:predicted enzyme related to lactoylglutathione lyase
MPRVVHFEISADEPERALKFYTDVFGWNTQKWEGPQEYWLVNTGEDSQPGINGGLMRRQSEMSYANNVNTVDVPSVDEYVARVSASGGKILVPKMPLPGLGYLAYCLDTEGNMFGIMQEDTAAK